MLAAIRASNAPAAALPNLNQTWITYADRSRAFAEVLTSVGGRCEFVGSRSEIPAKLAAQPNFAAAKKVVSALAELPGNVDLAAIVDPHATEDVDFAILPGRFGVSENGAIWVTDEHLRHRAIYFIVQHLVLVIDEREIVDNMYAAYQRLSLGAKGFGAFIAGPSKTADIEQSLVIGAHGPRSLTVFCVR
ncbi:MAG: LUD domain-containing protein [Planctomycetia bacterium]|nr:LUD domain-containing protein [Planctomycetia bacterium]